MSKKITFIEAKQRFIDQGRTDIELIEEGYKGWNNKSKFLDHDYGEFWAIPFIVFVNKSCHPQRRKIEFLEKSFIEAQEKFKDRDDIILCKDGFNGFHEKSKFWDKEEQEYFWTTPYSVFVRKSSHPNKSIKNLPKTRVISFEQAKERFKDRDDIELCEDGFVGWTKKSKFYDFKQKDYFFSVPKNVYNNKSCHPKRGITKRSQKYIISFEKACKKFLDQNITDIKLIKSGYNGWRNKSLFYDKIINDYFWIRPDTAFYNNSSHPKRNKSRKISFKEALEKFKNRKDIKLCKDGYNGWIEKSKFYDFEEKDYFWAKPNKVFLNNSCHPKRSYRNIANSNKITFIEAKQRFIDQGRTDIELIEEEYKGWREKSKFYDKVVNKYFYATTDYVFTKNIRHPKRNKRSKYQIELFEKLEKLYPKQKIIFEGREIINNDKLYIVDILFLNYKIAIEYNGDYWHCNPTKYNKNYYHKIKKMYAEEIWEYDKQRKKELEAAGYEILIVWEHDYKTNKEEIMGKLIKEINRGICKNNM